MTSGQLLISRQREFFGYRQGAEASVMRSYSA